MLMVECYAEPNMDSENGEHVEISLHPVLHSPGLDDVLSV